MELDKKFAALLPDVATPGQYVGGEVNSHVKEGARYHFALCFPDVYAVGMSSHGLRILQAVVDARDGWQAERAFVPFPDMEKALAGSGLPLCTLESRLPLKDCTAVGVSMACELHATGLLSLLDLGGIPLLAKDRGDAVPLVFAGGHATFNPEPVADFIDVFIIGDGEDSLDEIMAEYERFAPGMGRMDKIRRLVERVPGLYAPALYPVKETPLGRWGDVGAAAIQRRVVRDFDHSRINLRPVVPIVEVAHERVVLEIMRGCPNGCRFCQAGVINRPVRWRRADDLVAEAETIYACTGYDEIGLLSLSSSDYPELDELTEKLDAAFAPRGVNLSLPSLRVNERFLELPKKFKTVRKSGLTLAPEAGSDRLRAVINKDVTNENLLKACAEAFARGWQAVKLYFMIGLPTETDEDVVAIAELSNAAARLCKKRGRGAAVTCSVSNFIPKPFTPFQWEGMDAAEELARKQRLIANAVNRKLVDFKAHDIGISTMEGAFARAGRELGPVILRAWEQGARLDNWTEYFLPAVWDAAFAAAGLDKVAMARRAFPVGGDTPWRKIDIGISEDFLRREYEKSRRAERTPACGRGCAGCGVENCRLRELAAKGGAGAAAPE